jgi:hypothetical protein
MAGRRRMGFGGGLRLSLRPFDCVLVEVFTPGARAEPIESFGRRVDETRVD